MTDAVCSTAIPCFLVDERTCPRCQIEQERKQENSHRRISIGIAVPVCQANRTISILFSDSEMRLIIRIRITKSHQAVPLSSTLILGQGTEMRTERERKKKKKKASCLTPAS